MKIETRTVTASTGTIALHNVNFPDGREVIRKGTYLETAHLRLLQEAGRSELLVAVPDVDDVPENEAAAILAEALKGTQLRPGSPKGGRVNFKVETKGLLNVDAEWLLQFNLMPGFTLATLPQHSVVEPDLASGCKVATLKIIPYTVSRTDLDSALNLCKNSGIIEFRPFSVGMKAALLLVGDSAVHAELRQGFTAPTQNRLDRFEVQLQHVDAVTQQIDDIRSAILRLSKQHDLLVIAGQTSITDINDPVLHALRSVGAHVTAFGVPVEPGNLLALAYLGQVPILCAPGCSRGMHRNVIDLILSRLLLGDQLTRADIAALGLGGLLL